MTLLFALNCLSYVALGTALIQQKYLHWVDLFCHSISWGWELYPNMWLHSEPVKLRMDTGSLLTFNLCTSEMLDFTQWVSLFSLFIFLFYFIFCVSCFYAWLLVMFQAICLPRLAIDSDIRDFLFAEVTQMEEGQLLQNRLWGNVGYGSV